MTQGAQLAEGGFSFVYVATDARGRRRALKRIRCQSTEQIKAAQWELTVHRELTASGHPNLLPLADWGMRAEPRGEHRDVQVHDGTGCASCAEPVPRPLGGRPGWTTGVVG